MFNRWANRLLIHWRTRPHQIPTDKLAAKARGGILTAEEERELDDYVAVGSALEFLKSKARTSLKRVRPAA